MRGLKEGPLSYLKSLYFIRLGLFIMGRGHSNWSLHRTGSLPPYNISFVGMDDIVFFVENAFHPWRGFSEGKGRRMARVQLGSRVRVLWTGTWVIHLELDGAHYCSW
ncbi:hypothetical protein M758_1G247500 [Ceratodon purpureus]|nr:hypothetical protein M758_1G247500 [Ceratodon purpureus]